MQAHSSFRLLATMNPGGDFGKKELSPALRNRFTEIWVENALSQEDIRRIVSCRINQISHENSVAAGEIDKSSPGAMIALFCSWYNAQRASSLRPLTIRDCVSWAQFIQSTANLNPASVAHRTSTDSVPLHPHVAFIHGACLTLLDGLAAGTQPALPTMKYCDTLSRHAASVGPLHSQVHQQDFI